GDRLLRVLLLRFDLAQPRDALLVLVERLGKSMPAGAVGNEEEFLGAPGARSGLERSFARIGDRPRRQAVDHIGVVAGLKLDIRTGDRPAERSLPADDAVDDRRIGLQLHFLLEAIDEYRGDAPALLRLAGFFFDNGSKGDELVGRFDRQI